MAPEERYDRLLMAAGLLSNDTATPIEGAAQNGPLPKAINYYLPGVVIGSSYGGGPIFGTIEPSQYAGSHYQTAYGFPFQDDAFILREEHGGGRNARASADERFISAEFHQNPVRRHSVAQVAGESLAERLISATNAMERAAEALQEAIDIKKALLELSQVQAMKQAHTELYGPDPATGRTAAQEYLVFKQSQREQ